MNASELMFFFGAPLAHVALYEEHLRATRKEREVRELARARRPLPFPPTEHPLPALELSRSPELAAAHDA